MMYAQDYDEVIHPAKRAYGDYRAYPYYLYPYCKNFDFFWDAAQDRFKGGVLDPNLAETNTNFYAPSVLAEKAVTVGGNYGALALYRYPSGVPRRLRLAGTGFVSLSVGVGSLSLEELHGGD